MKKIFLFLILLITFITTGCNEHTIKTEYYLNEPASIDDINITSFTFIGVSAMNFTVVPSFTPLFTITTLSRFKPAIVDKSIACAVVLFVAVIVKFELIATLFAVIAVSLSVSIFPFQF